MMKKFFIILIFLIFVSSFANAIVVNDISKQIDQSNEQIIASNAENQAQISKLTQEIKELKVIQIATADKMVKKDDLPELYNNIYIMLYEHLARTLITILVVIVFFCSGFLLAKAKKVI